MRPSALNIQALLHGVSRSFGLSIRLLPAKLRAPVGLAYLLARIADTVADTHHVAVAQRLALLDQMARLLAEPPLPPQEAALGRALCDFASGLSDVHEKTLLQHSQDCLQTLRALAPEEQAVIRQVLAAIVQGQRWDLTCPDDPQLGVHKRQDVERYTWLVAGSVGEFWTRLCGLHLRNWHAGASAELLQWGANYGKGLQRLNILRDAHHDLHAGRCYFAAEELQPLGLDREGLCTAVRTADRQTLERMAPLLQDWQRQTEALLHDGLRYSLALRGRRLRLASALPCLIGIRTLTLLRQAATQSLQTHVKLPRREVRRLLLELVLTGVSDRQLRASWQSGQPAASA